MGSTGHCGAEVEQIWTRRSQTRPGFPRALDATTRMLTAMVRGGGLPRGRQATQALTTFFARASQEGPTRTHTIPAAYWMVRPAPPGLDGVPSLRVRGAVLVRVRGWQGSSPAMGAENSDLPRDEAPPLPPDLVAAVEDPRATLDGSFYACSVLTDFSPLARWGLV